MNQLDRILQSTWTMPGDYEHFPDRIELPGAQFLRIQSGQAVTHLLPECECQSSSGISTSGRDFTVLIKPDSALSHSELLTN